VINDNRESCWLFNKIDKTGRFAKLAASPIFGTVIEFFTPIYVGILNSSRIHVGIPFSRYRGF